MADISEEECSNKKKGELSYNAGHHMQFFDLCSGVYVDHKAALIFLVDSIIPNEKINDDSVKIGSDQALGIGPSAFINLGSFSGLFSQIRNTVYFEEFNQVCEGSAEYSLISEIDCYLAKYSIAYNHPFHDRYLVAFYHLLALIFVFYADDKSKDDEELILRDTECKQAIEAAEFLQAFLDKGGEMKSYNSALELNHKLQELIDSNSGFNIGNTEYERTSYLLNQKSRGTDYALRKSVFRLVMFFKFVHANTPTQLIKAICSVINPKVSSGTIDNYIRDAKVYMANKKLMKADVVPEALEKEVWFRIFNKGGLEAVKDYQSLKDKEYRKELSKKNTTRR